MSSLLIALVLFAQPSSPATPPIPSKNGVVDEPVPAGTGQDSKTREAAALAAADAQVLAASDGGAAKAGLEAKAEAEKSEPHPERATLHPDAGVAMAAAPVITPPSLSKDALCDELRTAAGIKKVAKSRLEEERRALAAERAKLEAMTADLAKAREQLRAETVRLEALVKRVDGAAASQANGDSPEKEDTGNVGALAKTMKAMKPAQAGALVSHLDTRLAAQVLQRMSPKDSGAVLASLKPELAAELMASLASLPPAEPVKGRRRP